METFFDIDKARLLSAGKLCSDAGWRFASHTHNHWEFVYFLRGCGSVNLPYATLRPRYYHLLTFYPGLPHAEMADPLDPEETIFFSVDVSGTPPPDLPLLLPDPHGDLRWLCEHIFAEWTLHQTSTPLADLYTRAFLHLIERTWQSTAARAIDAVDLAIQYLSSNYASQITLDMLSAITHVTPMHLTHCFSARVGISPLQYLKFLRIETAKQLLATTTLQVNEIAQRVGYADPLYFRRVFKSVMRQTPSECRQQRSTTLNKDEFETADVADDTDRGRFTG